MQEEPKSVHAIPNILENPDLHEIFVKKDASWSIDKHDINHTTQKQLWFHDSKSLVADRLDCMPAIRLLMPRNLSSIPN